MTDLADAGSVDAAAQPPAGTPAEPSQAAENGSAGASEQNPFAGLSEGTRKWVETKGYKTIDDAIAGGMNAESRLGSAVNVPAADAPQEEWDKFVSKLPEDRRPIASPDKIEFKRPEGYPEDVPYNDELAKASKPWMHEAGLSPKQAQVVHDKFVTYMAEQAKAQQAVVAEQVKTTHDALVKDWGPLDSDRFKQNLELADRALKKLGLADVYKAKGILLPDGSLTDPQVALAFKAVGETMFRDDTIGTGGRPGGDNPFRRLPNGERDVAGINALVRKDPQTAARLAREAGDDPNLWLGTNPL